MRNRSVAWRAVSSSVALITPYICRQQPKPQARVRRTQKIQPVVRLRRPILNLVRLWQNGGRPPSIPDRPEVLSTGVRAGCGRTVTGRQVIVHVNGICWTFKATIDELMTH